MLWQMNLVTFSSPFPSKEEKDLHTTLEVLLQGAASSWTDSGTMVARLSTVLFLKLGCSWAHLWLAGVARKPCQKFVSSPLSAPKSFLKSFR